MTTPEEAKQQIEQNRNVFQQAIASGSKPYIFPQSQITISQGIKGGFTGAAAGQQQRAAMEAQRMSYLGDVQLKSAQFEKEVAGFESAYKDYQAQKAAAEAAQAAAAAQSAAINKRFAYAMSEKGKDAIAASINAAYKAGATKAPGSPGTLKPEEIQKFFGANAPAYPDAKYTYQKDPLGQWTTQAFKTLPSQTDYQKALDAAAAEKAANLAGGFKYMNGIKVPVPDFKPSTTAQTYLNTIGGYQVPTGKWYINFGGQQIEVKPNTPGATPGVSVQQAPQLESPMPVQTPFQKFVTGVEQFFGFGGGRQAAPLGSDISKSTVPTYTIEFPKGANNPNMLFTPGPGGSYTITPVPATPNLNPFINPSSPFANITSTKSVSTKVDNQIEYPSPTKGGNIISDVGKSVVGGVNAFLNWKGLYGEKNPDVYNKDSFSEFVRGGPNPDPFAGRRNETINVGVPTQSSNITVGVVNPSGTQINYVTGTYNPPTIKSDTAVSGTGFPRGGGGIDQSTRGTVVGLMLQPPSISTQPDFSKITPFQTYGTPVNLIPPTKFLPEDITKTVFKVQNIPSGGGGTNITLPKEPDFNETITITPFQPKPVELSPALAISGIVDIENPNLPGLLRTVPQGPTTPSLGDYYVLDDKGNQIQVTKLQYENLKQMNVDEFVSRGYTALRGEGQTIVRNPTIPTFTTAPMVLGGTVTGLQPSINIPEVKLFPTTIETPSPIVRNIETTTPLSVGGFPTGRGTVVGFQPSLPKPEGTGTVPVPFGYEYVPGYATGGGRSAETALGTFRPRVEISQGPLQVLSVTPTSPQTLSEKAVQTIYGLPGILQAPKGGGIQPIITAPRFPGTIPVPFGYEYVPGYATGGGRFAETTFGTFRPEVKITQGPSPVLTVSPTKPETFTQKAVSTVYGAPGYFQSPAGATGVLRVAYKSTPYVIGAFDPWLGAAVSTAQAFQERDLAALERGEKLKAGEVGQILATGAIEGALMGLGGVALEKVGGAIGGRIVGKFATLGAKEGTPETLRIGYGLLGTGITAAGKYGKNILDTYFLGETGKQVVRTGEELYKFREVTPNIQREGLGMISGLGGFYGGKYGGEIISPTALKITGLTSSKNIFEYSKKGQDVILREPKSMQLSRIFDMPVLNILRRGLVNLRGETLPREDVYKPGSIEKPTKGVFVRTYETEGGKTIPTFPGKPSWKQMFNENLANVEKEGLIGYKAIREAFLRTPLYNTMIQDTKILNPSYNKLPKADVKELKDWSATNNEALPKRLQEKLFDTLVSDKQREWDTKRETPEVEAFLRSSLKIDPKSRVNVVYDPIKKTFITVLQDKTFLPTTIENIKSFITQRRTVAREQSKFMENNLKTMKEYGYESKSPPGHTTTHMSHVQDYFNDILNTSKNAKDAVANLIKKYTPEDQAKIMNYLTTKFAFFHDLGKRQSSSVEIKGLEHANVVSDVYKYGYAKDFDKDFYELPKDIQGKLIQAWRAHTDITPEQFKNIIYKGNPLAKILSNADRYDFQDTKRFGKGSGWVDQSKIFQEFSLGPNSQKSIVNQNKKLYLDMIKKENPDLSPAEIKEFSKTLDKRPDFQVHPPTEKSALDIIYSGIEKLPEKLGESTARIIYTAMAPGGEGYLWSGTQAPTFAGAPATKQVVGQTIQYVKDVGQNIIDTSGKLMKQGVGRVDAYTGGNEPSYKTTNLEYPSKDIVNPEGYKNYKPSYVSIEPDSYFPTKEYTPSTYNPKYDIPETTSYLGPPKTYQTPTGYYEPPTTTYEPPKAPPTKYPPYTPPTYPPTYPPKGPPKPPYPPGVPPKEPPTRTFREVPFGISKGEEGKSFGKKTAKSYEVFVRRRKVFRKESPFALTKEEALTFGARKALGSAAATFQLRASTEEAKSLGIGGAPDLSKTFRAPRRREAPETYIQISTKRIMSPGEKSEISLAGVAARAGRRVPTSSFAPRTSRPISTPTKSRKTSTTFLKSKAVKGGKSFFK